MASSLLCTVVFHSAVHLAMWRAGALVIIIALYILKNHPTRQLIRGQDGQRSVRWVCALDTVVRDFHHAKTFLHF